MATSFFSNSKKMDDVVKIAVKVLQEGGVILYPTDTIWGIGCDATNEEAVAKIYRIKEREDSKSMLTLIDNLNRLFQYVEHVPEIAWEILDVANKPLTIIYPNAKNLAANLIASDGSVGIRVVNHDFCKRLISVFSKPIVSTSANISGETSPQNFYSISEVIKSAVDYIVPSEYDYLSNSIPSGIIKLGVNGEVKVIRE